MNGDKDDSFASGDLIVAGEPNDVFKLEVGQIITFRGSVNGYDALVTHRIISVVTDDDGNALTYITHGDANPEGSNESVNPYSVLAVYKYHLKGVGSAINWLQQPTNFLLVIVVPLIVLFIYNIIIFVRMLMQWKLEKAAANNKGNIDEEEIRRKAIEEYLASHKEEASGDGKADNAEESKESAAETDDGEDKG